MEISKKLTIAIDGHSSCGKSTVAKEVARLLGYTYIDTGAMYRCVTLKALQENIINKGEIDLPRLSEILETLSIRLKFNPETGKSDAYLNGENVEDKIRGLEVSQNVSPISTVKFVRERMVDLQRKMGEEGAIVMDGRDIGTVVFPHADLKIFMTASSDVRAMRRYKELTDKGETVSFEAIKENVEQRDIIDSTRQESPLRKADDAVVLDNSNLTREEQLDWIIQLINQKFGNHEHRNR
jgi:CMP/dCMP kinase